MTTSPPPRPSLWLADDSPTERARLQEALGEHYDVTALGDGAEVIERLALERPDLLLVDWVMPQLSGLEVIEFVRAQPATRDLGIVVLTGSGDDATLALALAVGADDFLKKPADAIELRARVARLIRRRRDDDAFANARASRLRAAETSLPPTASLFMGIVAHDLRTPLSAIAFATSMLEREDLPPAQRADVARRARSSIARMNELIGRLLDLNRADSAAGIRIAAEPYDAAAVCENVVAELRDAHPGRDLRLSATGDTVVPLDPARMAQVVTNLVANALQHGDREGPVVITLDADPQALSIGVHNQGRPIPPALLPVIFDPFRRAGDEPPTHDGLGLGLYITDQLVRAHGGSLRVRSDAAGTLFTVRLPRIAAAPRA